MISLSSVCFLIKQPRAICEIEWTVRKRADMPRIRYNKGDLREYKLEVQEIFDIITATSSPPSINYSARAISSLR